jgi:hypothetical protein
MIDHPYQYVLELWPKSRDTLLGHVPIDVDWIPVREALILDLLRRGAVQQPAGLSPIKVEPIWDERAGAPTLIGFRAVLTTAGAEASRIFSTTYFSAQAQQAACRFVESGHLKKGDLFEYCVLAISQPPDTRPPLRFSVTQNEVPLRIKTASIERLMGSALLFGVENSHDIPVFFHWRVLEEASILTRKAGSMETGGVLIGNLCRDESLNELFLEISALIPAKAKGELTKLSFTPDTWTDVQAAVDLRNRDEIWLGWFHSHSFEHERKDKIVTRDSCARRIATPFLSQEDCKLHRVCFPRAFSIALLITDSPQSGMSWSTFGWRAGDLAHRAFHVVHAPLPAGFQNQGEKNESNRECIVQ